MRIWSRGLRPGVNARGRSGPNDDATSHHQNGEGQRMTERDSQLNDTATLDDEEVLSPEAPDDEPVAPETVESAAAPLLSPPQPGDFDLSPDGASLAFFQRNDAGAQTLWVAALDGSAPRAIPTTIELAESADPPRWSPGGATFAIAAPHASGDRSAIYLVTIETGEARLLVDHRSDDRSPKWAPDG